MHLKTKDIFFIVKQKRIVIFLIKWQFCKNKNLKLKIKNIFAKEKFTVDFSTKIAIIHE